MKLAAGGTAVLEAARGVPPYGFFLANGRQEVLLPYSGEGGKTGLWMPSCTTRCKIGSFVICEAGVLGFGGEPAYGESDPKHGLSGFCHSL